MHEYAQRLRFNIPVAAVNTQAGATENWRAISDDDVNESPCERLGQRGDGELLQDDESRADLTLPIRDACKGEAGRNGTPTAGSDASPSKDARTFTSRFGRPMR